MAEKKLVLVVGARLAELHEAVRYALSHGNGQVSIDARELQELLPELPADQKQPTHLEQCAAELQKKEADSKTGPILVETQTLSQQEVAAAIENDKAHPTQEEQERAKADEQPSGPVSVAGAGADPVVHVPKVVSVDVSDSTPPKPAA